MKASEVEELIRRLNTVLRTIEADGGARADEPPRKLSGTPRSDIDRVRCLLRISRRREWTRQDIAQALGFKPSAVSVALNRLEKTGFVTRDESRAGVYLYTETDASRCA